jgi:antitoxin HicB
MEPTELLKKPYARLAIPDEDGSFTAEIVEFPGCIASGHTMVEALDNLERIAVDWIAAALEQGQDIPEPLEAAGYSGKLVVRMSKSLHKRAAFCAERDGVSLNLFIVNCIAEQVGMRARPLFVQAHQVQAMAGAVTYLIPGRAGIPEPMIGWQPQQLLTTSSEWLNLLNTALPKEAAHARS